MVILYHSECVLFVLLQDFLWLLWAFHSGGAPLLRLLLIVGVHLGADWTLAPHGRCVATLASVAVHQNSVPIRMFHFILFMVPQKHISAAGCAESKD